MLENVLTIIVDNTNMTKEEALTNALDVNDQTGMPVAVCNITGDPLAYVDTNGGVHVCE